MLYLKINFLFGIRVNNSGSPICTVLCNMFQMVNFIHCYFMKQITLIERYTLFEKNEQFKKAIFLCRSSTLVVFLIRNLFICYWLLKKMDSANLLRHSFLLYGVGWCPDSFFLKIIWTFLLLKKFVKLSFRSDIFSLMIWTSKVMWENTRFITLTHLYSTHRYVLAINLDERLFTWTHFI